MKVNIDYDSGPGLRIIRRVIDGRLIWVRGFNGVGKTLAATMLAIASGGHKFEHLKEFESLKHALKFVNISIQVDEKTEFLVKLSPQKWEFLQEAMTIDNSTLGEFYLDGKEMSVEDFQRQFQAKIVKGNETLSTQIQEMIDRNISVFREWEEKTSLSLQLYADFVKELSIKLQIGRLDTLREKSSELGRLREKALRLQLQKKEYETIVESLAALNRIDSDIEFYEQHNKEKLQEDLAKTREELDDLRGHVSELGEKRGDLRATIRQEIVTQQQAYDRLLRRSEILKERIRSGKLDLLKTLQKLEISIELEALDPEAVTSEINAKKMEYRQSEITLKKQREDIFLKRSLLETADHIKGILVSEQDKLFDEVVAEGYLESISQRIELTTNELRDLVENRTLSIQKKLAGTPVEQVNARLKRLSDLRRKCQSVLRANKTLNRQIDELGPIKRRIEQFEIMGGDRTEPASQMIKELDGEIEKTQFKIFEHENRIQEINDNITKIETMPSLESLDGQRENLFAPISEKLMLDKAQRITDDFIRIQKQTTEKLEYELAETIGSQSRLEKEIAAIRRNIDRVVSEATLNDELDFLFQSIEKEMPPTEKLEIVRKRLEAFLDYVDLEILQNIKEVDITLEQMLEFQKQKQAVEEYQFPKIGETLEKIFNAEFLRNYSRRDFMEHVFRGFEEIVGFDLKNNEISLRDSEGEITTRLISAFSSGEKAFTFALAMISLFGRETASHKILFLDEFGALLDFVKEDVLLKELEREVFRDRKIEKVVILLPVKFDLEKQISELSRLLEFVEGDEKDRTRSTMRQLSSQAKDLKKNGYYQYETQIS